MSDEARTPEGGEGGVQRMVGWLCDCGHFNAGAFGDKPCWVPECRHPATIEPEVWVRYSDYEALERRLAEACDHAEVLEQLAHLVSFGHPRTPEEYEQLANDLLRVSADLMRQRIAFTPSDPDVSGGEETAEEKRSAEGSALDNGETYEPDYNYVSYPTILIRAASLGHADAILERIVQTDDERAWFCVGWNTHEAADETAEAESRSPKQSPPPIRAARQEPERRCDGSGYVEEGPAGATYSAPCRGCPACAPAEPQTRKCER